MGLRDRLFPRTPQTDWPAIGEDWAERYPALTAIGVRPWDSFDPAELDRLIGEALKAVDGRYNQ